MKKILIAVALLFSTASLASAQTQAPDPDFMAKALAALQNQRNQALDNQAALEAKLAQATDQLNKANAKIKELEDAKNAKPGEESKKK